MKEKILKLKDFKNTILVSAFPGTGKSYYFNHTDKDALDSDSSKFDKSKFPQNYIEHIKQNIGKVDVIMISSHEEVRKALVENGLQFILIYPDKSLKSEYMKRYKERGSPQKFIDLIDENWELWLDMLKEQTGGTQIELKKGEYISDYIE